MNRLTAHVEERRDGKLRLNDVYSLCPHRIEKRTLSSTILKLFPNAIKKREMLKTESSITFYNIGFHTCSLSPPHTSPTFKESIKQVFLKHQFQVVHESPTQIHALQHTNTCIDGANLYKEVTLHIKGHMEVKIGHRRVKLSDFGFGDNTPMNTITVEAILLELKNTRVCPGFKVVDLDRYVAYHSIKDIK